MVDVDSFLLIITGGISIIGGIIFGLYYTRIFSFILYLKKNRSKSNNSMATKEENKVKELEDVLKTKPDLIKKNSQFMEDELKIYQFEKDLATHAIENILLASKNKSIDSFEKDRLLLKYKEQLKKLNEKMEKIQSEIDVTKLITLRDDLAFLLDNKISDIDEKIKEINFKIGTNYKVKEKVNQDRINKTNDNSLKNIDNPFVDIEETVDANLSLRELTSYKNNPSHKRKEMVIESEREKIDGLKDQVLVALNKLDKIGDMKMEIDDQPDTKKVIQNNIFTFTDKDPPNNLQEKLEVNDTEHLSTQNDKKYVTNLTKKNLNIPKIFSFRDVKSENEIVTTNNNNNGTFDHLRKIAVEGSLNNEIDVNLNRINESNSFANVDINPKNQDHNKKTPLSNILNQNSSQSFNHSIESKYNKETYLSKDQSNKGKQSLNRTNNKKNIFKLPLAFIFSKITKQDENKKVKERIFETKKDRRDSLSNIVNKNKNNNRK